MQDLSSSLKPDPISALVPTSQHAGNQVWANNAQSAPGGASGDLGNDLDQAVVVRAPTVESLKNPAQPSDDGKPQPGKTWSPGHPSWGNAPAHSN